MRISVYAALALFGAFSVHADVTVRYQTAVHQMPLPGPDGMKEQAMKAPELASPVVRMKGVKASSTAGNFTTLLDLAKQQITIMDTQHKTVATVPVAEYGNRVAAAIPKLSPDQSQQVAKAMGSMNTKVESRKTGRTETIQGVQAEEREILYSMSIDGGSGAGAAFSGPAVTMRMRLWSATPGEVLRVPAIRELTAHQQIEKLLINRAEMIRKIAAIMPGQGNGVAAMMAELDKEGSFILRTQTEVFVPAMAALAAKMGQAGSVDPDAPFMEMTQETVEISAATLEDSLFEIPADYRVRPFEEVLKAAMPQQR
jgi:hypothetical protein